jgi:hypothetical protein
VPVRIACAVSGTNARRLHPTREKTRKPHNFRGIANVQRVSNTPTRRVVVGARRARILSLSENRSPNSGIRNKPEPRSAWMRPAKAVLHENFTESTQTCFRTRSENEYECQHLRINTQHLIIQEFKYRFRRVRALGEHASTILNFNSIHRLCRKIDRCMKIAVYQSRTALVCCQALAREFRTRA